MASKLTVHEGSEVKQWGVTISGGWNDWLFEAFVRQNGSWLINPEGTKANFTCREAEEALDFWVDLMHREKVGPPHSTWGSTPPDFVAQRTAMLYHSTARTRPSAPRWAAATWPSRGRSRRSGRTRRGGSSRG